MCIKRDVHPVRIAVDVKHVGRSVLGMHSTWNPKHLDGLPRSGRQGSNDAKVNEADPADEKATAGGRVLQLLSHC